MKKVFLKKEERKEHLRAWQQSGEKKKAYCQRVGIKYGTFISWFSQGLQEELLQKSEKGSQTDTQVGTGKFVKLSMGTSGDSGSGSGSSSSSSREWSIVFPNGIELKMKGVLEEQLLTRLYGI